MFVTFTSEDGSKQEWEFDPEDAWEWQAEAIERATKQSYQQWQLEIKKGGSLARRALLWHLVKLEHKSLRFDDLPAFRRKQLVVEFGLAELIEMRGQIESSKLDPDEKEPMLVAFDAEIEKRREIEGEPGKAQSPRDGTDTATP